MLFAPAALAERVNCWETQTSQIVAHTQGHTRGDFTLSGVSKTGAGPDESFRCTGTFEAADGQRQYTYRCELARASGGTLLVTRDGAQAQRWEGTAKEGDAAEEAGDFGHFPFNQDGGLPACAKDAGKAK